MLARCCGCPPLKACRFSLSGLAEAICETANPDVPDRGPAPARADAVGVPTAVPKATAGAADIYITMSARSSADAHSPADARSPAAARCGEAGRRWLGRPVGGILHPLPCHRFDARTQGKSPVR
jgi:hypothetical protein